MATKRHIYLLMVTDFDIGEFGVDYPYSYVVGQYTDVKELNDAEEKEKAMLCEKYGVNDRGAYLKDDDEFIHFMIDTRCVEIGGK